MKKKRIIGVLLLGIIAMTSLVWYGCTKEKDSQAEQLGTIYGTVTDYATGEPINNANVKLKPSGETTLTGSDGSFEFKDLKAGKYTLFMSKAEYADFDDDYVLEVEAGKKIRRDVQMRKNIASLKVSDMSGDDLTTLDFGLEESVTSKSFNIFNNGTMSISVQLSYNCAWIDTVIAHTSEVAPGQTLTVTVIIDRAKLSAGENATYLHIISANGSNEVKITATGYGAPTVTTGSVTNITATSAKCGGNVTDDGGTRVTDRGICWGTSNMPTIERDEKQSSGNGTGDFGPVTISHLAANTHYYVRAYATNARGTDYGGQEEFATPDGLPSVATGSVSNVTANSADCEGTVSSQGDASITDRGVVYNTSGNPTIDNGTKVSKGTGTGTFSASITGLAPNTTYYVRAYATNPFGTKYAEAARQFTTPNGLPSVTTDSVSNITANSVVCKGTVTSQGDARVTDRGVVYSTRGNPTMENGTKVSKGTGTGQFSASITGLTANTTYYVRAYATNSFGTKYAEVVKHFTTPDGLATISTDSVNNVTGNSAVCIGTVSSQGDASVTDRGIVYNTRGNPTTESGTKVQKGSGAGHFSVSITGLTANRTYYVRAYAVNTNGTAYGNQLDFTTSNGLPTVTTSSVSNVTANSAVCAASVSSPSDANVTERGVVYNTAGNPRIGNGTKVSKGSGSGQYSVSITGLSPSTHYYVCAYATNANGTDYGSQLDFTTPCGLPTVTTGSVSSITSNSVVCEGTVSSQGDASVTERGIVYNTSGNPTIGNGSKVTKGTGAGQYSVSISGLTPNTTYYVRAYATNSFGTKYDETVKHFTTLDGTPTVAINNISDYTATSAVCSGSVSSNGGFSITEKGFVYSTTQMPTLENCQNPVRLGSGSASFSGTITGLTRNTTYYVRAYATNSHGLTGYSEQRSFRTNSGLPTVTTMAITLNGDVAKSGGKVTSDGGYRVTARGICYGAYQNPDLSNAFTHTEDGNGTGLFTSTFDASSLGTIYVRAYATNENGTVYGEQVTANLDYLRLPTFTHNGYTYRVAPDPYYSDPNHCISASDANTYCINLTLYGYDDWDLPTHDEMVTMYSKRNEIGGFVTCEAPLWISYYSGTNTGNKYYMKWTDGTQVIISYSDRLRPSDDNNQRTHVRPIRKEQ